MAGNYPDAPGPRIAYDRDGTQGYVLTPGPTAVYSTISAAGLAAMNDEDSGDSVSVPSNNYWVMLYFPVLMDIVAYATWWGRDGLNAAQYSSDTTNGIDGTWTNFPGTLAGNAGSVVGLRNSIRTLTTPITGVKSVRLRLAGSYGGYSDWFYAMHLYGQPSATSDRLEFWHPTLDQPLSQTPAHFDYGNVARTSVVTKDFRIKNLSTTLTASSIVVGVEANTDSAAPTFVSQTQFQYNGGSYASTATLGALGPNTISQPFTVQLSTSTSTALSLWWQRYYAEAGGWA